MPASCFKALLSKAIPAITVQKVGFYPTFRGSVVFYPMEKWF
jgi:hypothetical protein